jgi:hypothetical protein
MNEIEIKLAERAEIEIVERLHELGNQADTLYHRDVKHYLQARLMFNQFILYMQENF